MCGIVGFTNYNRNIEFNESAKILNSMNVKLKKRGPDEKGEYIKEKIAMAHRRLIVIDKDGGKQPMTYKYQGNNYAITYNGQIYNCKDIRKDLEYKLWV